MKSLDVRQFCVTHWRLVCLYGLVFLAILFTATLKLHTLLPGFTGSEVQTYQAGDSLRTILRHPVNAPYLLLVWLVVKSHTAQPLLWLRAISATLAVATSIIFCGLLYYWHSHRVALLGTLIFGTSSWFLHVGRLGTPEVLLFGLFALVACGIWLQAKKSPYAMLVLLLLSAGLCYVPGMAPLIIVSMLINWKRLDDLFTKQLLVVSIGTVVAIGMLVPLGWAIYRNLSIGKALLNLPASGWPQPLTALRHIAEVPVHIFAYGQGSPAFYLGHLPVLSVFATVMCFLGGYVYIQHSGLQRVKLFIALFVAGCIVIGLGGGDDVSLLVPFLYLLAAVGISYLFEQWYRVFPRNPLAQTLGVICITTACLLVVLYNVRAYFISWPNAASTRAYFQLSDIGSPKTSDTIHR